MKSMLVREARRLSAQSLHRPAIVARAATVYPSTSLRRDHKRPFHASAARKVVKPYLLADIGEGITEVQIIQWFVQPGARVEQFDKICEVQSDKATVEITSRFDGIIKRLYYEADDTARVGKPLVDIDIKSEISPEDEALTVVPGEETKPSSTETLPKDETAKPGLPEEPPSAAPEPSEVKPSGKHATLATPAVRHMVKELNINIADISGTGKDGRVLKEDVQRHVAAPKDTPTPSIPKPMGEDKTLPLTPIQTQMFKSMTRSLSIPHFLYTDSIDFTNLTRTRHKLNASLTKTTTTATTSSVDTPKLTPLPFIIKAVSLALRHHPLLNSHFDTTGNPSKPQLLQKASHNIAVAIDTPHGLVVPVIRAVESRSIRSIAAELARLSALARANRLAPADLADASFTISNIGSIGGGVAAPVIVPPLVGILAVGRARVVPGFDEEGELVRREECVFSWSADHRIVDGAAVARCAERVKGYLEDIEGMLVELS